MPKLELLPSDAPYARPASNQMPITVSNLELRLPVHDPPGSLGGIVQTPAPPVVPPGYELASDYRTGAGAAPIAAAGGSGVIHLGRGKILATRKALLVPLRCDGTAACGGKVSVSVRVGKKKRRIVGAAAYSLPNGKTRRFRFKLTKTGRKIVAARRAGHHRKTFRARLAFQDSGHPTLLALTRPVHLRAKK